MAGETRARWRTTACGSSSPAATPRSPLEARLALTLRTLGGLEVPELAPAFLTTEPAMYQRLVRAGARSGSPESPAACPPTTSSPTGSRASCASSTSSSTRVIRPPRVTSWCAVSSATRHCGWPGSWRRSCRMTPRPSGCWGRARRRPARRPRAARAARARRAVGALPATPRGAGGVAPPRRRRRRGPGRLRPGDRPDGQRPGTGGAGAPSRDARVPAGPPAGSTYDKRRAIRYIRRHLRRRLGVGLGEVGETCDRPHWGSS